LAAALIRSHFHGIILSACLACHVLASAAAHSPQISVVLDVNSKGKVFDGRGAASAGAYSRL